MTADCNFSPGRQFANDRVRQGDPTSFLPTEASGPILSSEGRLLPKMEYPVYFFTSDHNICVSFPTAQCSAIKAIAGRLGGRLSILFFSLSLPAYICGKFGNEENLVKKS